MITSTLGDTGIERCDELIPFSHTIMADNIASC